jgi:hypothetical protein
MTIIHVSFVDGRLGRFLLEDHELYCRDNAGWFLLYDPGFVSELPPPGNV